MRRVLSTVLLGSLLAGLMVGTAAAGDNRWASIALHIAAPTTKNQCQVPGLTANTLVYQTNQMSTPGTGPYFFTYLLVCNGSDSTGIQGMECGIDYQGGFSPSGGISPISVFSWNLCGDLDFSFGGWPGPGSSNLITWTDAHCNKTRSEPFVPHTVIAIGGYFYMGAYAPGQMFVIPRPVSGRAKVADCSAAEDDITNFVPSHLGTAGWNAPGYNPCGAPTPVEKTTWGSLKSLYH